MRTKRMRATLLAASVTLWGIGAGSTPGARAQETTNVTPAPAEPTEPTAPVAEPGAGPTTEPTPDPQRQLLMTLFGRETTSEEYEAALPKAKAAGISPQVLLESQVVRAFYGHDKEKLIALKTPLQGLADTLDLKDSQLFTTRSDYDSMVEGLRALEAEKNDDAAGFETHIKEAVWLAPPLYQPLFLSWLNEYRAAVAMRKIVVPLDTKLMTSEGKETTFKEVLGDNKALLIDFWASWCAPCMAAMGELKNTGTALAPQGVVVVGLNTEGSAAKAAAVKTQEKIELPWLVEPAGEPYSLLLDATEIPRMVLVTREGKVLFNGHPADPALKTALAKVGAKL